MTKITKAAPEADVAKLASYRSQATELAAFLRSAPCSTAAEEAWFSSQLSSVRGLLKSLEDERTSITKPMLEAKRRVDGLFAPATKPLQECEGIIRGKLADAARARFAAEAEARRLAAEAAAAGDPGAAIVALASAPEAVVTTGSSARVVRKWRVVDLAAVPREYLTVDTESVEAALTAGVEIPGVEVYDDVAVRAK